jgi:glycosyltransferase involved in cell wall biosynthesis
MTERRRLLFLTSRVPWPPIGGDRLKNCNLIAELSKYFDLTMVMMGKGPLAPKARQWLNQFGPVHYFERSNADFLMNIALSPLHLPHPLQTSLYYFSDVQRLVDELAPSHDAIFCSLIRTARYSDSLNIPRVCDFSDSIGLHYRHSIKRLRNPLRRFVYRVESKLLLDYEAEILNNFEQSFFLNQEEMRHFAQAEKSTWIPQGTNAALLAREDHDPKAASSLVFFGKMDYLPNVLAAEWFAHEVLPLLPEHLRFTIVGACPSARVRALASERVEVTGFLADPYPILRGALAVVAPMLTGGGIQNKLLEAMALGCLTINTRHATRALVDVRPGIHLLVADTPSEFASQIQLIELDPARYASIGPAAREYIRQNFTWARSGRIYRDVIARVIAASEQAHDPVYA